ncbi:MAG: hypothetical protein ACRDFB_05770, partial [Rhabdochlamydiaceae bacterium]
ELQDFQEEISTHGYRQVIDVHELMHRTQHEGAKIYFVIRSSLSKDIYDFIAQYPTGQIELFDKERMKQILLTPIYHNSAVIVLLTKETLHNIQSAGQQLTSIAGLAYQN